MTFFVFSLSISPPVAIDLVSIFLSLRCRASKLRGYVFRSQLVFRRFVIVKITQ